MTETNRKRDYLTTTQAAEMLSVSPDTVLKWVKAGKLRAHRTLGGHFRIPFQELQQLAQTSARPAHLQPTEAKFVVADLAAAGQRLAGQGKPGLGAVVLAGRPHFWDERIGSYADDFAVFGSVCEPFEYLWRIIGSENSLYWMTTHADLLAGSACAELCAQRSDELRHRRPGVHKGA